MIYPYSNELRIEYIHKALVSIIGSDYEFCKKKGMNLTDTHKSLSIFLSNAIHITGNWNLFSKNILKVRKETIEDEFYIRSAHGLIAGEILQHSIENKKSLNKSIRELVRINSENKDMEETKNYKQSDFKIT